MSTFKTATLGCKVNQYETQYVREGLIRLGYREAEGDEPADLCVVNTCTVTAEADLKSRKLIRRLGRENPDARIIVAGCYAARAAEQVAAMPGVAEVVTDKRQLPELLARLGLVDVPEGISSFGRRHRAHVKVQDGCRMPCSFCIIPTVRPNLCSRPIDEISEEMRRLLGHGHREIVLTGIHLGHYGVDFPTDGRGERRVDLAQLVRRIVQLDGRFRVRISSLEASEATPELISVMADRPDRVCPHLHLSMQSGSDAVLARMRRRYKISEFLRRCEAVRRRLDQPALTTDVIVGFPGETEADFAATCRAVREVEFSKIHVFRFSPRQGTPAAEMTDQVGEPVKRRRAAELAEIGRGLRQQYLESLLGRRLQVLAESRLGGRSGVLLGTSGRYTQVELLGGADRLGQLVWVTAEAVKDGRVCAADCPPREEGQGRFVRSPL